MLLALLLIPLIGIFLVLADVFSYSRFSVVSNTHSANDSFEWIKIRGAKVGGLAVSIINLIVSLTMFILFDFSDNQFQFVQEYHEITSFHIYLGVDGLSIYFILLTTLITPIALLSN